MSRLEAEDQVGRERVAHAAADSPEPARGVAGERLVALMKEFRRRQRRSPELVVRPWWAPGRAADGAASSGDGPGNGGPPSPYESLGAVGFIVEYCPRGVESAELAVRTDRVRVEGPAGVVEGRLDLETGWSLDGQDRICPETLANHLLRMADRVLD
jgi:hypothetical protein